MTTDLSAVEVGQELPGRTLHITRADLVAYAGASLDRNPIHWDDRFAQAVGLPDVIAHGMFTMGAAVQVVVDWCGDAGRVVECSTKFVAPVVVPHDTGADVEVGGVVSKVENGSATVEIEPGFTGEMTPEVVGLAKAQTSEATKVPGANASTVENASSMVREVTVGEGVKALNVSITAGSEDADWDLYVIDPAGRQISAATAASSESLTINNPAPGRYLVIGFLYSTVDGGPDTATFEALQLTGDAGNLTVTPNPVPVVSGIETEAELAWSGLTEGVWRGVVTWAPGVTTTVTVTVGAGGGPVDPDPETCDVADFRDNPEGSQYYSAVRWMQCADITTGFADGTYRKGADISRGQSLAFMYRYLDPEFTAPATSPFRDVAVDSTFYEAITWAAANGVTKGYADSTFKQHKDVTRAEFASFVFRAVGEKDFQVPAESPFTDLLPGQTHYQAITWMESEGLLKGYQDGSFGVGKPITRGEVAVIMERVDAMMQEG